MEAQKSQPKAFFKCFLPQCSGLRFNLVHRFPRNIERAKMWLNAFNCSRLNATPHLRLVNLTVCCRHFRVEDYVHSTARTLNHVAVPSLNLKKLNELQKCRQPEIEKATVLSVEEAEWIKSNQLEEKTVSEVNTGVKESSAKNHSVSDLDAITYSAQEVIVFPHGKETNATAVVETRPVSDESIVSSTLIVTQTPQSNVVKEDLANDIYLENEEILNSTISTLDVTETIQTDLVIEEESNDIQIVVNDGVFNIINPMWDIPIHFDALWLRSLCRCSLCYDVVECTPNKLFFNLSKHLQPIMATVTEESEKLEIVWSDAHTSIYDLNDLYEKYLSKPVPTDNNYLPWNSKHITYRDDLKPLKFYDILAKQSAIYTALDRLKKSGVLIIEDIPKCDKDSVVKKSIISKLFNHLWDNLTTEKRLKFPAHHTTPFTNCTFESADKGLQILTIPYYKENLKMQVCLADGFHAATQLRKVTSEFLTQTSMDFGFISTQGYKYIIKHPIIAKAESVERIMYSPYQLEDLKSQDFKNISMHLKHFNDILSLKQNQWNVELTTETMIILDNYRICWCINEADAEAELDCFYMERKHYLSSLNILKDS